uniref:Peptidase_C25 domain-containing protein n=1 Tax=Panagrellus redivivus TaxID=6233 RepID=A0A7E4USY4_PANRE
MLVHPSAGLIATRDKLTVVRGSDLNEISENMYKTAPDVKVVYFFTMSRNYEEYNETITALKSHGFKNVTLVNSASWFYTEQLNRSSVKCNVGECVAFFPLCSATDMPAGFTIYKKTADGYDIVGTGETAKVTHFSKCTELKNIVAFMITHDFSEFEKAIVKDSYPCQTVNFIGNKGRKWLKCIWDEYDGNVQNFLPAVFTLNVRFKFGNNWHIEKIEHFNLPFKKEFELDIDDACKLDIVVNYDKETSTDDLKPYYFDSGKSRILKINLKVGFEFIPEIDVTVASEKDTVEGVVYSVDFTIDYINETKYFTGTLITAGGAGVVVERSNDISDVFKQLEAKKGSAKLRGVFVDYPGHDSLPLDTHRAVVAALPSPKTKVCVGRTHSEWAIHLRNSSIKLKVGEYVVIANWIVYDSIYKTNYYFMKTEDGFQVVDKYCGSQVGVPLETVIVIVKEKDQYWEEMSKVYFPNFNVIFSAKSELPENVLHDFAWQYFNGKDFYGFMVRPYRGVSFTTRSGDFKNAMNLSCDFNSGTIEKTIACMLDKCPDSDAFYSQGFYGLLEYVGYKEQCTVLRLPMWEIEFIHVKISVDENLIPTVTFTEADSPLFPMQTIKRKSVMKKPDVVEKKKVETVPEKFTPHRNPTLNVSDANTSDSPPKLTVPNALNAASSDVTVIFTHYNKVLISAGTDYTGDKEIPGFLRLKYTNGIPEFLVGSKARAGIKKSRHQTIYDVPGLLAANFNPDCENDAWTFHTSRADDGSLLIHLNAKDKTSPVVVFGHILQATLQHISDHLPTKLERVGIRLPSYTSIQKEDLSTISSKLGVDLVVL